MEERLIGKLGRRFKTIEDFFMSATTTTTPKGEAIPETSAAENLELVSPSTQIPGENPEFVERAREAYNLGCQEREILYDLAEVLKGSEGHFASILHAAGYPLSLVKKYAELAAWPDEETAWPED